MVDIPTPENIEISILIILKGISIWVDESGVHFPIFYFFFGCFVVTIWINALYMSHIWQKFFERIHTHTHTHTCTCSYISIYQPLTIDWVNIKNGNNHQRPSYWNEISHRKNSIIIPNLFFHSYPFSSPPSLPVHCRESKMGAPLFFPLDFISHAWINICDERKYSYIWRISSIESSLFLWGTKKKNVQHLQHDLVQSLWKGTRKAKQSRNSRVYCICRGCCHHSHAHVHFAIFKIFFSLLNYFQSYQ